MNTQRAITKPDSASHHAPQHTRIFNAIEMLMVAGALVGGSSWPIAQAMAAVETCGRPAVSGVAGAAVTLWENCDNGSWNISITGGRSTAAIEYVGSIKGSQPADMVVGSSIESNDVLDASDPSGIAFRLFAAGVGIDSVAFAFPSGTPVCLNLTAPIDTVLVGPNRTPVKTPFDLRTMGPCGHAYLDDAETTDSVTTVSDTTLADRPFPRITTGPLKKIDTPERFSKYSMIAVKPSRFDWLKQVQEINPETMGLRIFAPFGYQGFNDTNPCTLASGMPFGETGDATTGCSVYAGHWLYSPGSILATAITASTTSLRVTDASRFIADRYIVIYDGAPGAFVNAEHAKVTAVNTATNTLTLTSRGLKSTARFHPAGAIVATHVIGNGDTSEPELWVYNLSTTCPRDANGRQFNEVMASWISENYSRDPSGRLTSAKLEGILYDSDFHFIDDAGNDKSADVNNDLVLDNGVSPTGDNYWGNGLSAFYDMVRERLPNAVIVGGVIEARGYTTNNGTQLEGWPQRNITPSATPDYREINGRMTAYSVQMRHGQVGPRYCEGINKMPTKLYPSAADPNPPNNTGFRFGFGLMLLDDGYYGQQNWHVIDPWWDEYAVDVVRGSPTFGHAIASTPENESLIRSHSGWMGFPLGPRYRVYDPVAFAPERSLLTNGTFDVDLSGWTGSNVTVTIDTEADNRQDGSGALRISQHLSYAPTYARAFVRGPNVSLISGRQYTLAFSVRSSAIRTIQVAVGDQTEVLTIPDIWSRQVFTFTAERTGQHPLRLNVGRENTDLLVDSMYLLEGNADVFRRDFDNAVVVVNATPSVRTVDLGGTFMHIQGTGQDPINNGADVTQVTLDPYDSTVLIRP